MNVGELRSLLSSYSDDTLVLVEGEQFVTKVSEIGDVKFKECNVVSGFQTFDYEYDDWDTTREFSNELNACLITIEDYYIRALNPFRKEV